MLNLIRRFFRVVFHFLTLGIVKLEKKTASQRRQAIIDEKIQLVAEARRKLGALNGAGRTQARRVSQAEQLVTTLTKRKAHFMSQLVRAPENSPDAQLAEESARRYHRELKDASADLNRERTELQAIYQEYEGAKSLVSAAEKSVAEAKREGERLARRKESAQRRTQILETTASLKGLGGVGEELTEMDRLLREEIDQLEGTAFTTAEHMAEQLAEQELDVTIATSQAEDEFETELREMRSAKVPALPESSSGRVIDVTTAPKSESVSKS